MLSTINYLLSYGDQTRAQFWLGILKERDQSEDLGVDGRTVLKLILWKQGGRELDSSASCVIDGGKLNSQVRY